MHLFRIVLCALCLLACAFPTLAQGADTLTNKSIVTLHKAGLGKSLILTKIQTSACRFKMNTDDLIELKKSGVPDDVVDAMLRKGSSVPATPVAVAIQAQTNLDSLYPGIYVCQGTPCNFKELEPSVFSQQKRGSGILTTITYGIAKTKQKATLSGPAASRQIKDSFPVFYFVFDRNTRGTMNGASSPYAWSSAATSANEFILVQLTVNSSKKSREVVTGSYNSYSGLIAGVEDAQKKAFQSEKLSQGIYKVSFSEALPTGEYCFMYAGSAPVYGGTPMYRVFDFGVSK